MRTKEELNSPDFNDDMTDLIEELETHNIAYTKKVHKAATPQMLSLIGYYPTGKWHIKIGDVSVIRGYASFGLYEAYGGKYEEPERFETGKELVEDLQKPI